MLVHSFSPTDARFTDYFELGRVLGVEPKLGEVTRVGQRGAMQILHLGWAKGEPQFLEV
jgi:hypothetical protein